MEPSSTSLLLHVFTHREGLAKRFGHDLRLSTRSAHWTLQGDRLDVKVPLCTLEVDGAMRGGQLDTAALSSTDRNGILRAMRNEVLESDRHPEARFAASVGYLDGGRVVELQGELTLKARSVPLVVRLEKHGTQLVGRFSLQPTRWGIRPYSAMAGALKVTDSIDLRCEVTLEAELEWPPATLG